MIKSKKTESNESVKLKIIKKKFEKRSRYFFLNKYSKQKLYSEGEFPLENSLIIPILEPPKTLIVHNFYKLNGDIVLTDDISSIPNYFIDTLKCYNLFKKVLRVSYDHKLKILISKLSNYDLEHKSLNILIERLQSLGDNDAFILSKTIEAFLKNENNIPEAIYIEEANSKIVQISDFYFPPKTNILYKSFLVDCEQVIEKYTNKPCIIWLFRKISKKTNLDLAELSFNQTLIDIIGINKDKLMHKILRKGYPGIAGFYGNYFKSFTMLINKVFLNKDDFSNEKINIVFATEKFGNIKASLECECRSFEIDDYMEYWILEHYEIMEPYKTLIRNYEKINIEKSEKTLMEIEKSLIIEDLPFRDDSIRMINQYYKDFEISKQTITDPFRCKIKDVIP